MYEDSLTHYGVLGMKWGRRKSRSSKGSNVKKSSKSKNTKNSSKSKKTTKKREKILTDSGKETLKTIAKTTAKVAGAVAATTLLGYAGSMAYSEFSRLANQYHTQKSQEHALDAMNKALSGDINGAYDSASKSRDNYLKTNNGKALTDAAKSASDEWDKLIKGKR